MSSKINKTLADLDSLINKLDEYLLNKKLVLFELIDKTTR